MHSCSCAAPTTHRRQLGNLECNIDRGEIVFHVAQLAKTIQLLGNATDLMAAYVPLLNIIVATACLIQGITGTRPQTRTYRQWKTALQALVKRSNKFFLLSSTTSQHPLTSATPWPTT